jgi:hypothetical protein
MQAEKKSCWPDRLLISATLIALAWLGWVAIRSKPALNAGTISIGGAAPMQIHFAPHTKAECLKKGGAWVATSDRDGGWCDMVPAIEKGGR